MKLADQAEAIELSMRFAGNESTIYPVLLWDGKEGATLVDTGLPGSHVAIQAHLTRLGLGPKDLRRIILTHQDLDHIGGAAALVQASGAEVWAHADELPYIQGERPLIKMDPARIEKMLEAIAEPERSRVRQLFGNPPKVHVDRTLSDGEELPIHGGIVVIHTPGHTPGHISLFLRKHRLLVSGDALRAENGDLLGPSPGATPDLATAAASLRKLLGLPIERVLCYHGGLSGPDPLPRLRELAV